ncbi:SulP family inorganic anion transporter [Corynebacterium sp. A21]|uniref:SulP family inorganic anion transporter n=1 Tax=Corynebacterium sp. A21 TaxID=3457318 RepID=UPI003FD25BE8
MDVKSGSRWRLPTLSGLRTSYRTDLIVGLTLAAIALPGSMAAAQLVGISPALGLLAFCIGALVFALAGGHRTLSVGPDSTIAPMLAAGAAGSVLATPGEAPAVEPGSLMLISLMVGALLILIGVIRGGWITQFLSRPVTVGLLAGVGLSIIVSQLSTVLGMDVSTSGNVPQRLAQLAANLGEINPWVAALSGGVLVISIGAGLINHRLPGALIGLALAAVVTAVFGLAEHGVAKLEAPESVWTVPAFSAIPWASAPDLLPAALVIVILVTVQTGATEASTRQGHETLDRDLGAIGVASLAAAVAGSFALNASPPRTRLVQQARGHTQLAALTAGTVVLVVLLFATGLLALLPEAALAAVLLHIAVTLIRFRELRRIARYSWKELGMAVGTTILVCVFGIVSGVAIAALVTLLDRTRREARPPTYRKGLIPQSNHWVPVNAGVETVQVPEVLVWSVEAPIWYADADYVIEQLHEALAEGDYSVVVLDGAAISDLDYTGVLAMGTLIDHLVAEDIPVLIARPTQPTQNALKKAGLAEKVSMHPTVSDAVKEGTTLAGLEAEFRAARGKKKDLAKLADAGLDREELLDDAEVPGPEEDREH